MKGNDNMGKENFHSHVQKNGGYIFSDGTLRITHLLAKAFDLLVSYNMNDELQKEILTVFEFDEDGIYDVGLFEKQFYDEARILAENVDDASYIWNEDVFNFFMEISPDGYSFGSSEGDGALIGWFKVEEE